VSAAYEIEVPADVPILNPDDTPALGAKGEPIVYTFRSFWIGRTFDKKLHKDTAEGAFRAEELRGLAPKRGAAGGTIRLTEAQYRAFKPCWEEPTAGFGVADLQAMAFTRAVLDAKKIDTEAPAEAASEG
jgi:hypothetical protein